MSNLIDNIEHEVSMLPDNDNWCSKYTWNGKRIKNKQLRANVLHLAAQCRQRYEKGGQNLLEHLYTLFPIAPRVVL